MAGNRRRPGARPAASSSEAIVPPSVTGSHSSQSSVGPRGALRRGPDNNAFRGRYRAGPARSNLATVKLMGRKRGHEDDLQGGREKGPAEPVAFEEAPDGTSRGSRRTDPKGRPT